MVCELGWWWAQQVSNQLKNAFEQAKNEDEEKGSAFGVLLMLQDQRVNGERLGHASGYIRCLDGCGLTASHARSTV